MNPALKPGMSLATQRVFDRTDITALTELTGAPDSGEAVPEALINGMFSYLLGVDLPGQGTNYLKQETDFLRPARLGDTLTARVEITRLRPDKHLVDLRTTCTDEHGELIADGRALVLAKDVSRAWG